MNTFHKLAATGLALAALVLSGCAGYNGNGTPVGAAPAQGAPFLAADAASNLAGQYAGKVQDSKFGKGKVAASIAQYKSAVGGLLGFAYKKTATASTFAGSAAGNAFRGTAIANVGKATCTLTVAGTYDTGHHRLSGSYQAVRGCSGESGTYAMKERCYYRINAVRRPDIAGLKPC